MAQTDTSVYLSSFTLNFCLLCLRKLHLQTMPHDATVFPRMCDLSVWEHNKLSCRRWHAYLCLRHSFLSLISIPVTMFFHISALAACFLSSFANMTLCLLLMHRAFSHGTETLAKYFTPLCCYLRLAFAVLVENSSSLPLFISLHVFYTNVTKASLLPCS